jgi:hypothetical protein
MAFPQYSNPELRFGISKHLSNQIDITETSSHGLNQGCDSNDESTS